MIIFRSVNETKRILCLCAMAEVKGDCPANYEAVNRFFIDRVARLTNAAPSEVKQDWVNFRTEQDAAAWIDAVWEHLHLYPADFREIFEASGASLTPTGELTISPYDWLDWLDQTGGAIPL